MKQVRIICRNSRLSLIQGEMVRKKVKSLHPGADVIIIPSSSRGDRETSVPLSSLDGVDFFTQEIFEALESGEADLAVHSLKDMSAPHFFSHNAFAVIDRDDVHDVAIFNPDVIEKLKKGDTIHIGTCSPRREEMAVEFLRKALPQFGKPISIEVGSIRGNVEGRLAQLAEGKYDATILATAGLNRLLVHEKEISRDHLIENLLKNKLLMLLPLIECAPAPCQGAIVVEASSGNKEAVELLQQLNRPDLFADACAEKKRAFQYGTGCLQKFGVATLQSAHGRFLYAAGEDQYGKKFTEWEGLPVLNLNEANLFSSTDHMRSFFEYRLGDFDAPIVQKDVFVANYKALLSESTMEIIADKNIWASGTKTWFELAKRGLWVKGSADAMGFEKILPLLKMPLLSLDATDMCILTHHVAAKRWREKGFIAVSNYELLPQQSNAVVEQIRSADHFFWSSYAQYEHFGHWVPNGSTHICAAGETAQLLKKAGLNPHVFPTIKSFEQWRKLNTALPNVA